MKTFIGLTAVVLGFLIFITLLGILFAKFGF